MKPKHPFGWSLLENSFAPSRLEGKMWQPIHHIETAYNGAAYIHYLTDKTEFTVVARTVLQHKRLGQKLVAVVIHLNGVRHPNPKKNKNLSYRQEPHLKGGAKEIYFPSEDNKGKCKQFLNKLACDKVSREEIEKLVAETDRKYPVVGENWMGTRIRRIEDPVDLSY